MDTQNKVLRRELGRADTPVEFALQAKDLSRLNAKLVDAEVLAGNTSYQSSPAD